MVVILPASLCAALPMFQVRSSVYSRFGEFNALVSFSAAVSIFSIRLKNFPGKTSPGAIHLQIVLARVGECLVRLRHSVTSSTPPNGASFAFIGFHNFLGQGVPHQGAFAGFNRYDPPERQTSAFAGHFLRPDRWRHQRGGS